MNIPKEIGARIPIEAWDEKRRCELEGRGFVIESGTPQICVMRRDFRDGSLKTSGFEADAIALHR